MQQLNESLHADQQESQAISLLRSASSHHRLEDSSLRETELQRKNLQKWTFGRLLL